MRWLVLGAYALLAAATQLLWLTYAAIDTDVARALQVDVGTVGDLSAIFPGLYIVLALPTGRWLDLRFEQALSVGAVLVAAGAILRALRPESFAWQLGGQVVIAAAQPLVLNSINKVAARYFPPEQRALAIAVGSAALFAGILAAALGAAPLFAAGGIRLLVQVHAAAGVAAAAAILLALPIPAQFGDDVAVGGGLGWLRHDRFLWTLAGLLFIGIGTYNAVATFLEPVLDRVGEGSAAGALLGVMTLAGIVGAATLAPAAAARDRRRLLLAAALIISAIAFAMVAAVHVTLWTGAWLAIEGFFLLACLPVVLDWAEVHTDAGRQGAAVGFLWLAGNLGGLVYIVVVQVVIDRPYLVLGMLATASLAGLALVARLPARSGPALSEADQRH